MRGGNLGVMMETGFEKENSRETTSGGFSEGFDEGVRSKTSNRMFYEAQVAVIQKQLGNLEKIRQDLGLSQRKICQLLLVDPSAWTRWNRDGEKAPPHIWRALQWYMTLQEKIPGLTPQYFIGKDPQILHEKALSRINEEKAQREFLEAKMLKSLRFHRRLSFFLILTTVLIGLKLFVG